MTYVDALHSRYDNFFKAVTAGGWANDSDGDVQAPTGWFARVSIADSESMELIKAFQDEFNQIEAPVAEKEHEVIGFFGCEINEQGIIWVYRFASQDDLEDWYNEKEAAFSAWSEQNGDSL